MIAPGAKFADRAKQRQARANRRSVAEAGAALRAGIVDRPPLVERGARGQLAGGGDMDAGRQAGGMARGGAGIGGGIDQDADAITSQRGQRVRGRAIAIVRRVGEQAGAVQRVEAGGVSQRQPGVGGIDKAKLIATRRALPLGQPAKHCETNRAAAEQGDFRDGSAHQHASFCLAAMVARSSAA